MKNVKNNSSSLHGKSFHSTFRIITFMKKCYFIILIFIHIVKYTYNKYLFNTLIFFLVFKEIE